MITIKDPKEALPLYGRNVIGRYNSSDDIVIGYLIGILANGFVVQADFELYRVDKLGIDEVLYKQAVQEATEVFNKVLGDVARKQGGPK